MTKLQKKNAITKKEKSSLLSGKILIYIYSFILVFVFFSVYNSIFDKKIDLNGDNASYYILAKSLAEGNGFRNAFEKENRLHTHYPPGYPAILAVTQKVFSDKIITLKKANGLFFLLSIAIFFMIVYKLTDNIHLAFIVNIMLISNATLMRYSTIMMSEMPFLFFSLLSLLLMISIDFSKPFYKSWKFLLLILFVAFSYYIKSLGLALIVGVSFYFIYKRHWKYLLSLIIGFGILRFPWYLRSKTTGGGSYIDQLLSKNPYRPELGSANFMDILERIWLNFQRYVTREIPSGVFNISDFNYQEAIVSSEWFTGIILVIPIIYGLFNIKKYASIFIFYLIGYFGILMLWPQVWFGPRFMLPIVPILTFLFFHGIYNLLNFISLKFFNKEVSNPIIIGFVVLSLFFIKHNATDAIGKIQQQAKNKQPNNFTNYFKLGTWIKNNTPENSITASRKVKLLYLYSNKFGFRYKYTLVEEEQIEYLKEKNADYVILDQLGFSSTARYLYPAIKKYPNKFKLIKHLKNPDTYLFKFEPDK